MDYTSESVIHPGIGALSAYGIRGLVEELSSSARADNTPMSLGDLIIARGYVEGRERLLTMADPFHNSD